MILFAADNPFRFRSRYRKELNLIVRNLVGRFKMDDRTNYSIDINDDLSIVISFVNDSSSIDLFYLSCNAYRVYGFSFFSFPFQNDRHDITLRIFPIRREKRERSIVTRDDRAEKFITRDKSYAKPEFDTHFLDR